MMRPSSRTSMETPGNTVSAMAGDLLSPGWVSVPPALRFRGAQVHHRGAAAPAAGRRGGDLETIDGAGQRDLGGEGARTDRIRIGDAVEIPVAELDGIGGRIERGEESGERCEARRGVRRGGQVLQA